MQEHDVCEADFCVAACDVWWAQQAGEVDGMIGEAILDPYNDVAEGC